MKILVCGGRDFSDYEAVERHLDAARRQYKIEPPDPLSDKYISAINRAAGITHVIHGDARGADRLAGLWAKKRGIQEVKCPANWDAYVPSYIAGPIRNRKMLALLTQPDYIIAFPGGSGTDDMMEAALRAGFTVVQPMEVRISKNVDLL